MPVLKNQISQKKRFIAIVVVLALLLILIVIWVFKKRIEQIENRLEAVAFIAPFKSISVLNNQK